MIRFLSYSNAAVFALALFLSPLSCHCERQESQHGKFGKLTATAEACKWDVGDAVFASLSDGSAVQLTVSSILRSGAAILEGDIPQDKYLSGWAIYPWGNHQISGNTIDVEFPSSYDGVADRAVLCAKILPGQKTIHFKPLGGKISATFENIPSISGGAVFSSSSTVAGTFSFNIDKDGEPVPSEAGAEGAEKEIHIRFNPPDDGSLNLTIPLPEGKYDDWSLILTDAEGNPILYTLQQGKGLNVSAGTFFTGKKATLPRFNSMAAEKVYAHSDIISKMYEDDMETTLAEGITETVLHFTKDGVKEMHAFIIEADLGKKGNSLQVGAPFADPAAFGKKRQTLSEQAPMYIDGQKRPVVIVNADFWAVNGIYKDQLRGPIHTGGQTLKDSFLYEDRLPQQALSFAGLKRDGSLTIGKAEDYPSVKTDLAECTGGGVIALKDGTIPDLSAWPGNDPRTVFGYKGQSVVFLIADGRQQDWSNGLTYYEMGSIMKALGCDAAVNLDGGGSTQLLVLDPAKGEYEIRNRPSDGQERAVAQTWIIFSDHAR